jgi:hypothetical protein
VLWHFDELSEFARSGHGGFNATSDRGQMRRFQPFGLRSGLSRYAAQKRTFVDVAFVPKPAVSRCSNMPCAEGRVIRSPRRRARAAWAAR